MKSVDVIKLSLMVDIDSVIMFSSTECKWLVRTFTVC